MCSVIHGGAEEDRFEIGSMSSRSSLEQTGAPPRATQARDESRQRRAGASVKRVGRRRSVPLDPGRDPSIRVIAGFAAAVA
jgi:hypothetical protein